jgi:hypothetical protein
MAAAVRSGSSVIPNLRLISVLLLFVFRELAPGTEPKCLGFESGLPKP